MPRIRQVVSEQQAGVVRLPRNIPVATAQDLGIGAAQAVEQFGGQLGEIAQKVQDTADELEVSRVRGEYDAAVADLQEQVKLEPDTFEQAAIFTRNLADLQNNTIAGIERAPVAQTLQRYFNLTGPAAVVDVQATSIKIANDKQIDLLNEQADKQSKIAARTEDPDERQKIMDGVAKIARNMAERGQISFTAAGKFIRRLPEKVIIQRMNILARTDRPKLREEMAAGLYDQADEVTRLKILDFADAEDAKLERVINRQRIQQRFDANKDFFRRLHLDDTDADFLNMNDVIDNPFLTRDDRTFFERALKKTEPIRTNNRAFLEIVNLLQAPTKDREAELRNAERGMQMAKDGMTINETLSRTDAMTLVRWASDIIGGDDPDDPEKDAYFKQSVRFLKRKFGWQGGDMLGQFIDPKGAEIFDRLIIRLMDDVRRQGIRGRAIFDRADELAKAHAVNWLDGVIEGFANPTEDPVKKQLPSPITWRGQKQIIFPNHGRAFEIDDARTKWTEIPVPTEE